MRERVILQGRVAIEKAALPDEALALGQVSGGDGIYIEQSDGSYIDESGLTVWDIHGKNNLVMSSVQSEIQLTWVNDKFETYKNFQTLRIVYGKLIETSAIVVNSVPYSRAWFDIHKGTDSFGVEGQALLSWNGRFPIESTDECYWRIG